jgi:hypothetical protein
MFQEAPVIFGRETVVSRLASNTAPLLIASLAVVGSKYDTG